MRQALDDGVVRCHRQDDEDEDEPFVTVHPAKSKSDESLRTLHEADLAVLTKTFCARPAHN